MDEHDVSIQIRVRAKDLEKGVYIVEAELENESYISPHETKLDRQKLLMAQFDSQSFGFTLFNALCTGPIREAYTKALGRAQGSLSKRLRVRLWLDDDVPELHSLPWERMNHLHDGQVSPISTSTLIPFSRFMALP